MTTPEPIEGLITTNTDRANVSLYNGILTISDGNGGQVSLAVATVQRITDWARSCETPYGVGGVQADILDSLLNGGSMTLRELAEDTGRKEDYLRAALRRLQARGLVKAQVRKRKVRIGRHTTYKEYTVSDARVAALAEEG